jgi:hypothetical protein
MSSTRADRGMQLRSCCRPSAVPIAEALRDTTGTTAPTSADPSVVSRSLSLEASRGHGRDGPADPEPPVGFGPDSYRAGPPGVLALVQKQRLVIGTDLVPKQVPGGRAGGASGGDILDTAGVVPGGPSGRSGSSTQTNLAPTSRRRASKSGRQICSTALDSSPGGYRFGASSAQSFIGWPASWSCFNSSHLWRACTSRCRPRWDCRSWSWPSGS